MLCWRCVLLRDVRRCRSKSLLLRCWRRWPPLATRLQKGTRARTLESRSIALPVKSRAAPPTQRRSHCDEHLDRQHAALPSRRAFVDHPYHQHTMSARLFLMFSASATRFRAAKAPNGKTQLSLQDTQPWSSANGTLEPELTRCVCSAPVGSAGPIADVLMKYCSFGLFNYCQSLRTGIETLVNTFRLPHHASPCPCRCQD